MDKHKKQNIVTKEALLNGYTVHFRGAVQALPTIATKQGLDKLYQCGTITRGGVIMATNKERMNLFMSTGLKEFYSQLASEMGVTVSACMVMALKSYMDAQKGMQMGTDLKAMVEQLQLMQKKQADSGKKE